MSFLMKHHLFQIYYGGFKTKLKGAQFCKHCNAVVLDDDEFNWVYTKEHKETTTKKSLNNRFPPSDKS